MNCKLYRTEIEESGLDAATAAPRLQSHLRECDACRKFYEERAALRRLLGNLEPVAAPPDFDFRLRARLAAGRSTPVRALFRRSFAPGTTSVAVLACLVLGITLLWRLLPSQPNGASVDRTAQSVALDETKTSETLRASADADASKRADAKEAQRVDEKNSSQASAASQPPAAPVSAEHSSPESVSSAQLIAVREGGESRGAGASKQTQRRVRASRGEVGAGRMASAALKREDARGAVAVVSVATAKEAGEQGVESRDFAEKSAPRLRIGEPLMLPVGASAQPLKILLRDEGGASRMVALQPVSFGAQQFGGRLGSATATTRAPLPSREGVW